MGTPKLSSSPAAEIAPAAASASTPSQPSQPQAQPHGSATQPSRTSTGGGSQHRPSSPPAGLDATSSPIVQGGPQAAAPGSPPKFAQRSDNAGMSSGAGNAGTSSGAGNAGTSSGAGNAGTSSGAGDTGAAALNAGGTGGGNTPTTQLGGHHHQHKYAKRSSDSGGGVLGSGLGLGFLTSPPAPKGASVSGVPTGPPQGTSFPAAAQGHSGQQQQQGTQSVGTTQRRLQQLGQRLNFGLNLGRKKQTTFAPGVAGGNGGGGVQGGSSSSGGPTYEDTSGGGPPPSVAGVNVLQVGGPSFASSVTQSFGHGQHATSGITHASSLNGAGSVKPAAEEFNPPNHPVNPFSYLATPFRVMAKTKAGVAVGRYATTALRLRKDGVPPASYMWLWLGNFKRWHRRYFVASEAPGVLRIYKRANMKGKLWTISLRDATVVQDNSHPRQIQLVIPNGTIFLRVLRPEEREPWIACIKASVEEYRKHKEVVDKTLAAAGESGEAAGAGALPSVASGAVEQDAEQRRRVRTRLAERLAELGPLVAEVERHLGLVGHHLTGAASGIGQLNGPLLPQNNTISQLSTRGVRNAGAGASVTVSASAPESGGGALATAPATAASSPGGVGAAEGATGALPETSSVPSPGPTQPSAAPRIRADAPGALLPPTFLSEQDAGVQERLPRSRSRSRGVPATPTVHAPTLAGAVSGLVDAFRATLYNESLRIATLEAENAALNKTIQIMRTNTHRNAARARGVSTPGLNAAGPSITAAGGSASVSGGGQQGGRGSVTVPQAISSAVAMAAGGAAGGFADDAVSEGSACTADEDAFDVVEPFDDGVDYSILDDDAPHLHHRLGVDDDETPYVQHGNYPGAGDEEQETDEEAEEDARELLQQAEVLNALEVVRQVEYIANNNNNTTLKTLLTADTPPPPDAEEDEDEGGKRKRKSRGKGEDTDATLDDEEDDDDDDEVVSSGGAGGTAAGARRPYAGRSRLPAPKPLGRGFSIWSILKNMIGRDLTKITMPATINEPVSMTQRMAEVLENRALLERAAVTPTSVDRLMLVSCWLLAGYNSQPLRDNKPFNPLLGETFEWQAEDGSARYLCEQVSHHPPVSCFVADGGGPQGYELYGEVETKTKFWGKTIDLILAGHMSLKLRAFGEEYRFNLGTLVINDIILGRFWIDLSCDMKIRNQQTGDTARLIIKPCRGYPYMKERGKCDGVVCDSDGREVWRISGSSMSSLHAALTPEAAAARGEGATSEPQLIWTKEPELPNPTEQYCMTRFALGLNDPADPIVPHLPPTDARFRPDMRALELGEWNRATTEKLRLEEKQRTVRRLRKEAGQDYEPRWFKKVLFDTKEATQVANQPGSVWEFTNEYWDARERKDWGELPDLY